MADNNMTTGQRFFISSAWFLAAGLLWFTVSALFWYFTVFNWKQIIGHFTILIAIIFLILYILRYIIELRNGPSPTEDTPILAQNTLSQPVISQPANGVGAKAPKIKEMILFIINNATNEDINSLLLYSEEELAELYTYWKSGKINLKKGDFNATAK